MANWGELTFGGPRNWSFLGYHLISLEIRIYPACPSARPQPLTPRQVIPLTDAKRFWGHWMMQAPNPPGRFTSDNDIMTGGWWRNSAPVENGSFSHYGWNTHPRRWRISQPSTVWRTWINYHKSHINLFRHAFDGSDNFRQHLLFSFCNHSSQTEWLPES